MPSRCEPPPQSCVSCTTKAPREAGLHPPPAAGCFPSSGAGFPRRPPRPCSLQRLAKAGATTPPPPPEAQSPRGVRSSAPQSFQAAGTLRERKPNPFAAGGEMEAGERRARLPPAAPRDLAEGQPRDSQSKAAPGTRRRPLSTRRGPAGPAGIWTAGGANSSQSSWPSASRTQLAWTSSARGERGSLLCRGAAKIRSSPRGRRRTAAPSPAPPRCGLGGGEGTDDADRRGRSELRACSPRTSEGPGQRSSRDDSAGARGGMGAGGRVHRAAGAAVRSPSPARG